MMLNEKLDYITKGETLEAQVSRAKEVASIDPSFAGLMRMATTSEEKIDGLPEGMPDTYKPDSTIPDGISDTTIRQEYRRIRNFQAGGSMMNIPVVKRELSWIQMLEGMHWKEASLMVHIKDQTLLEVYPNLREVLETLGVKISVPAPKKKATRKKKNDS